MANIANERELLEMIDKAVKHGILTDEDITKIGAIIIQRIEKIEEEI